MKEFKIGDQVNVTLKGVIVGVCETQVFKRKEHCNEEELVDAMLYTVFLHQNQSTIGVDIPSYIDDEQIPMEKIS